MLTALTLALLVDPAHAASGTEVGTARKFGLGASVGNGYLSAAAKYWFKPNLGISGYVGNGWTLFQLRVNLEHDLFTIRDMDFGRLDLYWLIGADAGVWALYGATAPKLGFGAGLGANLKLHDTPLDIFLDVGLGGYPFDYCTLADNTFCVLQPRGDVGARYYFP